MEKYKLLVVYLGDLTGFGNRDRIWNVCKVWHKKGHEISILLTESMKREAGVFFKNENINISIFTIPYTAVIKKFSYLKVAIAYLLRLILCHFIPIPKNVDIIYSITGVITEVFPAFIFKIKYPYRKWIVVIDNTVHSPFDHRRKQNFAIKTMAYSGFLLCVWMCKKADIVLTVNDAVREKLISLGIKKDRICITGNGVSLEFLNQNYDECDTKSDAIFLGRIDYSKGVFALISMWAEVCKIIGKDLTLSIIGHATHRIETELHEKIKKMGIEKNVLFHGYLTGDIKYKLLRSSRLFVFPSIDESWGIAIMEALSCGLPVIAYNLDVYHGIYPDSMIERVPLNDTKMFVTKIVEILSSSKWKEHRQKRVEFARHFGWEDVCLREYNMVLESLFTSWLKCK